MRRRLAGSTTTLGLVLVLLALPSVAPAADGSTGSGGSGGTGVTAPPQSPPFGVGEIVATYTDWSRRVFVPHHGLLPRRLVTVIRYPAAIDSSRLDVPGAPPATGAGRLPLIVFAHGYNITPTPYAPLLQAWVRAGYVVAAPIFPLSNAAAPGGPDESDLVNQPTDMSYVISRVLAGNAAPQGILSGIIDPQEIAVAGQSDGGSTALAAAYNRHYVDRRIRAAMILSGALIPGIRGYNFPPPDPPLLAVQGTGDLINLPSATYRFYKPAPRPKFLLSLIGAPHLGPYTSQQPQLGIVERVTIAFLDHYLKQQSGAPAEMRKAGNVPRLATLTGSDQAIAPPAVPGRRSSAGSSSPSANSAAIRGHE